MKPLQQVAVLGAGVMGAQIAAHFANAHIAVKLFDLAAKDGNDKSAIAKQAIKRLAKLKPAPLAEQGVDQLISPRNYEEHIAELGECDLIIEAIAEKLEWKRDLYERIAPHIRQDAIVASNTSGLSIETLAASVPSAIRQRFCGVHFFNPPRYMHLVEIIPCTTTDSAMLDDLETLLVSRLGKGVVRAKNTPNFIANRVGVFAMLAALQHAERLALPFNVVDQLTGRLLGRPKSATFRTSDVVGIDTFAHVVNTMTERLHDDPWHSHYQLPNYVKQMIEQGALGQKSGAGFYKKQGKTIFQLDTKTGEYVAPNSQAEPAIVAILKERDANKRLHALRNSDHPQAQFVWAVLRDTFHYCAVHLGTIAHSARDIDFALRWGFGWDEGPFETWQKAGWQAVATWIKSDIDNGLTLANVALPDWVFDSRQGVHFADGSYDANSNTLIKRSDLAVYQRQLLPATLYGEAQTTLGKTISETANLRTFTLDSDLGKGILVASFTTKMHTISHDLLQDLQSAIKLAEAEYEALVIWHPQAPFSAGADLSAVKATISAENYEQAEAYAADFQQTALAIRRSCIPVVCTAQGLALGGGCEFLMHADRVVAALESYIGLVEVGVGLLPGGGGTKEFAMRAAAESKGDILAALKDYYLTIATAKVSTSAVNAQELGYLRQSDVVIFNPHELLYVGLQQARALAATPYRPVISKPFKVAGMSGAASIKGMLINMLEGQMISDYDYEIACVIADIITGGDVYENTLLDEDWLIDIERQGFMELAKNPKTHERIIHMLETGKPLRN